MRWPWQKPEQRSVSISDPAVALLLGFSGYGEGPTVSESVAMTLSAVFRSVSLISGSIASLPLRTITDGPGGLRTRAGSFLDNPGRDRYTPFEWKELNMVHLLLHGNTYLQHVYNGAGALAALHPIHPRAVETVWDESRPGGKRFTVRPEGGQPVDFDASTMTQIMGLSLDGLTGISPITAARLSLGTGLQGDRAAHKQFQNGAMISGLVTPEDDLTEDEAKEIKTSLGAKMQGTENAGDIAVINRKLKFQPWTLSAEDAQFLQSRTFQVDEVGRWFGLPPHLLGLAEKQTSWGSGIAEQNRGLARYTLTPWTTRIDERMTRLLPTGKKAEFDYTAFVQPAPEDEINLLISQVNSGLLTLNEARAIRNMAPVPGGDVPRFPAGTAPTAAQEDPQ